VTVIPNNQRPEEMEAVEAEADEAEEDEVAIIGSGFGGLGMAIRLSDQGERSFVILEKADRVGGTWRENTYPGAACDVPAHLYSYSFHRYDWSRRYPPQEEILAYIEDVVSTYRLGPHLRFGATVTRAVWDGATATWTVTLADGRLVRARVLVSSVGQLNRPAWPDIPGRESFTGPSWHSATWDHDTDLSGLRVGVVGTGASAIQFVPPVAEAAAHVTVFQRSAPYILPKPDRPYSPTERRLFAAVPAVEKLDRLRIFSSGELLTSAILGDGGTRRAVKKRSLAYLEAEIDDPDLRRACTPDYELGCKRILFTSDWYATLRRPNVDLVTADIDAIEPGGVRTADGVVHPCDVLIYGTGFAATDFLQPMEIVGRDGLRLHDCWAEGAHAYRGVAVAGFPNLFLLYGPNTNLGGNSIIYMLEAQIRYVSALLGHLARLDLAAVEVRADVEADFVAWVDRTIESTAWQSGCHSWYRAASGRNTNNWPLLTHRYARTMRHADLFDYEVTPRAAIDPAPVDASVEANPAGAVR